MDTPNNTTKLPFEQTSEYIEHRRVMDELYTVNYTWMIDTLKQRGRKEKHEKFPEDAGMLRCYHLTRLAIEFADKFGELDMREHYERGEL